MFFGETVSICQKNPIAPQSHYERTCSSAFAAIRATFFAPRLFAGSWRPLYCGVLRKVAEAVAGLLHALLECEPGAFEGPLARSRPAPRTHSKAAPGAGHEWPACLGPGLGLVAEVTYLESYSGSSSIRGCDSLVSVLASNRKVLAEAAVASDRTAPRR